MSKLEKKKAKNPLLMAGGILASMLVGLTLITGVITRQLAPKPPANPAPISAPAVVQQSPKQAESPKEQEKATTLTPTPTATPATAPAPNPAATQAPSNVIVVNFPASRYPNVAAHWQEAMKRGETDLCTIDRAGAAQNRRESTSVLPTKTGYDRDEFPFAMCKEGGTGADVAYMDSSENRSSGAWMGNALEGYQDGTSVQIVIDWSGSSQAASTSAPTPTPAPAPAPAPEPEPSPSQSFANCTELRSVYPGGVPSSHPAYRSKMDRDHDGWACES